MKSLVVSRWAPNRTDGGAALRNAQNVNALAALGPVEVVTIGAPATPHPVPGVARWRHFDNNAKSPVPGAWLFGRHPIAAPWYSKAAVQALGQSRPGAVDLAVVEEISLAPYIPVLKAAGLRVVFDAHNVEAALRDDLKQAEAGPNESTATQLKRRMLARRLFDLERKAVTLADAVWACSALDRDMLVEAYRPARRPDVVPNTIPLDTYAAARAQTLEGPLAETPPRLLYVGTYSYAPNEAAALRLITQILPALRREIPGAELALVGRHPTQAMHKAAGTDPGITITGAVDSVVPWYGAPCIVTLPITHGSGTRLKILEAFAAGACVVSTAKGAEGLAVTPDQSIVMAESDAAFVTALTRLMQDPGQRRRLGQGGYELVKDTYSWQAATRLVAQAVQDFIPEAAAL